MVLGASWQEMQLVPVLAGADNVSPIVYNVFMVEIMTCVKAMETVWAHGISIIQVETYFS